MHKNKKRPESRVARAPLSSDRASHAPAPILASLPCPSLSFSLIAPRPPLRQDLSRFRSHLVGWAVRDGQVELGGWRWYCNGGCRRISRSSGSSGSFSRLFRRPYRFPQLEALTNSPKSRKIKPRLALDRRTGRGGEEGETLHYSFVACLKKSFDY